MVPGELLPEICDPLNPSRNKKKWAKIILGEHKLLYENVSATVAIPFSLLFYFTFSTIPCVSVLYSIVYVFISNWFSVRYHFPENDKKAI